VPPRSCSRATSGGPDDQLRLQFEAISRFDPDEKKTAKEVLDGLILKHEARKWASAGVVLTLID
jgi:hypothetical protein